MEVYFECNLDSDRMSIFHRRLEAPFPGCLDGLFVEAHTERVGDANVGGTSASIDHQHEGAGALVFRFAGLFREFRIDLEDYTRRAYTAAHVEDPTAGAATLTGTKSWTFA